MISKKHAEPAHDREQLLVEHERLRVAQTQTQDLTTEEARERAKRMGEIEREIAKLDEPAGNENDDDAGSDQARSL
jgi:hypothetical protein